MLPVFQLRLHDTCSFIFFSKTDVQHVQNTNAYFCFEVIRADATLPNVMRQVYL